MPFVQISEKLAHYDERGAGKVIILVHAATQSGKQWYDLISHMSKSFRYLLPDLYGCGKTKAWPSNRPLSIDDEAEIILTLLDQVKTQVHLIGHSYGGAVALRAALKAKTKISSLSLIEPGGLPLLKEAGYTNEYSEYNHVMTNFFSAVNRGDLATAWRDFLVYYRNDPNAWSNLTQVTQASIKAKTALQIQVYIAQKNNPITIRDLRFINCPTLMLLGDRTTPPEAATTKIIARNIKKAKLTTVPNAGHSMVRTHPSELASILSHYICQIETDD